MTARPRMPYQEQESPTTKWVALFVLLSILAHVAIILAVVLISVVVPPPKLDLPPPSNPTVSLSLMPAPQPPPQKRTFMPTAPQPNAPHKDTLIESDNDTQLTSHSKQDRTPDALMPDVVAKNDHSSQLSDSPNVRAPQKQPMPPTPPSPKQEQAKQEPTSPQPKPQPTPVRQPTPDQQKPPPKPPTPQVVKNQVDPLNGLPLLPPISAPTMAPQASVNKTTPSAVPTPIDPAVAANVQGRAGMSGSPSPEATATELGKYKAKVYRAVGSLWYQKVAQQLQLLGVGSVRVQYTISADGTVTTKVLDAGNSSMQMLLSISINSIREASPFDPFTDSMRKELARTQAGNGDNYTDDFSFSVYTP